MKSQNKREEKKFYFFLAKGKSFSIFATRFGRKGKDGRKDSEVGFEIGGTGFAGVSGT